jgi:RNA-binding protein
MLTSKQRSYLRGLANTIEPIFQVGKGGIGDNLIKQFNDALEARELIKATVLKNSEAGSREIADEIADKVGADVVQVIGNRFVLYKESEKHNEITSALSVIR